MASEIPGKKNFSKLAWSIGLFCSSSPDIFSGDIFHTTEPIVFHPRRFNSLTGGHTLADPFLFVHGDRLYVFYELQNRSQAGQINAYHTSDLVSWENTVILKEKHHVSFPFVFRYEENIYLIPESFHANEIALYEFERFPDKLVKVKTLVKGRYSDPVFFRQNKTCYLFATNENNELAIFFANNLMDEWRVHPQNPITANKSYARNGGPVFSHQGKLLRISQDFSRYYGEKVQLLEITTLSETKYREVAVNSDLVPKIFSWNQIGTHHFSYAMFKNKHIVAIDGLSNIRLLRNILGIGRQQDVKGRLSEKKTGAEKKNPTISARQAQIKYRPIDLHDDAMNTQVNKLLQKEFGIPRLKKEKILLNTETDSSSHPTLYMGAFDGDQLVGFNALISHDLYFDKEPVNCYQSCWIATRKEYRGQNIFSTIVKTAEEILRARNAHFIFSFPNVFSRSIFLGKLGFTEYPSYKLNIPCIPYIPESIFSKGKTDLPDDAAYTQNDSQLLSLKRQEFGKSILVERQEGNMIWGKLRSKRIFGFPFRYFDVGGLEITNPREIHNLFEHIKKKYPVLYIQLITTRNNTQNRYFNNFAGTKTNDLVLLMLNGDKPHAAHFNFYAGIKDVF